MTFVPNPDWFGYQKDERTKEAYQSSLLFPYVQDGNKDIRGTGKGKKMLGYEIIEKVAGYFPIYLQMQVGDCVAQSHAPFINLLKACEIYFGDSEEFVAPTSVEDLYGGGRIIIGKGSLGYSDGMIPVHSLQYMRDFGTLLQKPYPGHDLSKYSPDRSRDWGSPNRGVPKELLDIAKEHRIKSYSQVKTYAEVCDLLFNGYPISVASNVAFTNVRDKEGFARIDWNNRWPHQMYVLAYDDEYSRRPGVLIMNSWPTSWISGPKRHNQPEGSFWVDASEFEKYVLGANDSWTASNFDGYKIQSIDPVFI